MIISVVVYYNFLYQTVEKKKRKWSGRDVNMNHTTYFPGARQMYFSFTLRVKDDGKFLSSLRSICKATGKPTDRTSRKPRFYI